MSCEMTSVLNILDVRHDVMLPFFKLSKAALYITDEQNRMNRVIGWGILKML